MRVAFDATSLLGPRTGVGAFAAEVLERLAARDDLDISTFSVSWRGRGQLPEAVPPGVRVARLPMAARPLRMAWLRGNLPPIEWWTGPVDVVHGPNFVVPPARRAAEVVTVHDLTCVRFPELCTADTLEYPGLIRRAIDRGAWIHTVSSFVADEVRATFSVDPDRVVAIDNGVDALPALATADAEQGRRLAGAQRYVLALGTVEPRKGFPLLVRAFDALASRHDDLRLVLAGPDGWGAEALGAAIGDARHRDRIVRLGWVTDHQRAALLRGAAVFAFPSIYEGFGLPPLEAMAAGVPVVATAAGALPDTVGDAARLVPVGDLDALTDALDEVVSDAAAAAELVDRGYRNVERFSWDRTATALADLYQRAAG